MWAEQGCKQWKSQNGWEQSMKPQLYMKNHRQLRKAGNRKGGLPQRRIHQKKLFFKFICLLFCHSDEKGLTKVGIFYFNSLEYAKCWRCRWWQIQGMPTPYIHANACMNKRFLIAELTRNWKHLHLGIDQPTTCTSLEHRGPESLIIATWLQLVLGSQTDTLYSLGRQ